MRMGLILVVILAFVMFSANGYAYNITAAGHYCHNCTDCMDAINNNTHPLNTTYLNMSISNYIGTCINNPSNFTNVTFDCQGYTIDGDDSGTDYGIYASAKNSNQIKNCIITDFSKGIYFNVVPNSIIENNTITSNTAEGILIRNVFFSSDNNIINGNTLTSNNYGLTLYTSSGNNVTNNTANSNSYGIYLYSYAQNNTLVNNIANSNNNNGIKIYEECHNTTLIDNTVNLNNQSGIYVYFTGNSTFINNTVNSNGIGEIYKNDYGIYFTSVSEGNNLIGNTVNSNYGTGIYYTSSGPGNLTDNTVNSNYMGILIASTGGVNMTGNIMNSNTYGLYLIAGDNTEHLNHYITQDNTINGKPAFYYRDQTNTIFSPSDPGFVGCFNCSNVTFSDFTVSGNGNGIVFAATNNSNITRVNIGNNYVGFLFDGASDNNTVSNSFIYNHEYQSVIDYGTNNIFLDDNIYMYDMIVPAANTWYTSFSEMSFKLSNLTYGNMSCEQYINSSLVNTNNSVKANQKTPFTYVLTEGPHSYYFYCNDINYTQIFDFSTASINFGIKMSLGASCTADIQCASGYCTNGICSISKSSGGYVPVEGGLPSTSTTIPLTLGPVFVPSGGLIMIIDNDTTLDLYGTNAYINDIYVIDPNSLSPISCNQTALSSYEIDVDIDDKAYVCFDKADYSDLQSITVYTIKENEWKELDEIVIKGDKICGRITSSPYMIAGFSIPATADKALESIQLASSVADTDESKSLVDQASQAYLNCEYDRAYDLSQNVIKTSSEINISRETAIIALAVVASLSLGYYFKKHPQKIKNLLKKSKRKK